MKKDGTQKIKLKKLIIARINTDAMRKIEGGSSVLTATIREPMDGHPEENICYYVD